MGEGFGLYSLGDDAALMPYVSVANIACGFHGSDYNHMRATVRLAKQERVRVGAHPSLPDLVGFGRREMKIGRDELANIVIYQVGALQGFLKAEGLQLNHIKPHGALYGMASRDEQVAHAICDAAEVFQVPVYGMTHTLHETVYPARGVGFVPEFYADLEYDADGHLIITRKHAAIDAQWAADRAIRAVTEGLVTSIAGTDIAVRASTICVHSDTPNAVDIARAVKGALAGRLAPS
jgi:UPF0271 protein